DDILAGILHDDPSCSRLPGECDLVDLIVGGERLAGFGTETVDDVHDTFGNEVSDELHQVQDGRWCLFRWFQYDGVARSKRRCEFPCRHEQREVPRDDLSDDTERLMVVVGDCIIVNLGNTALLCPDGGGEVSVVVDHKGQVGVQGLADSLAVLKCFKPCEFLEIYFDTVGDLKQNVTALGW